MAVLVLASTYANAGTWVSGTVKNAAGSLEYKLWTPSAYKKEKAVPLVLMLHGCTQNAEALASLSGMNELSEKNDFLVAYPEQGATANPLKCWNWFDPKHQSRDAGEPALIAAVIQDIRASFNIDNQKVFVAGISAGGAMAIVMAATYPDVFAGVGVIAGTEFKAATSVQGGLAAMKSGGPDPNQQGLLAFESMSKSNAALRKRIPLIAFQGAKDPYVNPVNADQLIAQWAQTNDYLDDRKDNDSISVKPASESKGSVPNGYSYTKYTYNDSAGRLLMEKWIVDDLGHAWPGSRIVNQFADAKGPDATAEIWRFFNEVTSSAKAKGGNE
jgi:poly(hydroxyalkanoate) depolymerase family esterase